VHSWSDALVIILPQTLGDTLVCTLQTNTMTESPRADRIRDNQRRSRERKKQRIEELEARVREFEKLGVDATKAMQVAARRVDEDNKKLRVENGKLRAMLKKHGYVDATIDACLNLEPEPLPVHRTTPAVQSLQTMFNTRRFPDTPNMVTSSVDDPSGEPGMPTSPTTGWPHGHPRRNLSQDYTPAYALHHSLSSPQSPGGYDAVDPVFTAGLGWGPSGSGAQLSSSSSGSAGPRHDEFDDEQDGTAQIAAEMLMGGRHYGVHPDTRYAAWVGDARRRH
jgi:hypothetical protein